MIRSLALAAGFLVVTIGLLILQPSPRAPSFDDTDFDDETVTRAGSDPAIDPSPVRTEVSVAPVPHAPAPQSAAIGAVSPAPVAVPRSSAFDVSENGGSAQDIVAMMNHKLLMELRAKPSSPATGSAPRQVPQAPAQTVALSPAPAAEPAPAPAPAPLAPPHTAAPMPAAGVTQQVIARAQAGAPDNELIALLRQGVVEGSLLPDPAFYTSLGDLDYGALLASLVPGRAAAVGRSVTQDFVYRVQPGDSLAGLAVVFYGDAREYPGIFAANSERLKISNQVSSGMLLTIPAR